MPLRPFLPFEPVPPHAMGKPAAASLCLDAAAADAAAPDSVHTLAPTPAFHKSPEHAFSEELEEQEHEEEAQSERAASDNSIESTSTCSESEVGGGGAARDQAEAEAGAATGGFHSPSPSPWLLGTAAASSSACTSPWPTSPSKQSAGASLFHSHAPCATVTFSPTFTSVADRIAGAASSVAAASAMQELAPTPALAPTVLLPPPIALPSSTGPIEFSQRFHTVRTLQSTLFGKLLLCQDLVAAAASAGAPAASAAAGASSSPAHQGLVVVKESSWSEIDRKQRDMCIQEDVRKEARIMRWLGLERPLLLAGQDAPGSGAHPALHLQAALTPLHVDPLTCGLSAAFLARHSDPSTGLLGTEALRGLAEGARFIAPLHGEFDSRALRAATGTPDKHYLCTGYAAGGELFEVVRTAAGGRVGEGRARKWFRQLLQALAWSHARSVAHLDLSLENCCVDSQDNIQLIDWGLAMLHPSSTAASLGGVEARSMDPKRLLRLAQASDWDSDSDRDPEARDASEPESDNRVRYLRWTGHTHVEALCDCAACCSSAKQLAERAQSQVLDCEKNHPHIVAQHLEAAPLVLEQLAAEESNDGVMDIDSGDRVPVVRFVDPTSAQVLLPRCKFLLRPVCRSHLMRPGKLGSSAPELLDSSGAPSPWDAYAADLFALGVLLWTCLTGQVPFAHAGGFEGRLADNRAQLLISGAWMDPAVWRGPGQGGQPGHRQRSAHYTHLSHNAWSILDACFKPQHLRPTVDELLQHPWMDEAHPNSVPSQRV